MNSPHDIKLIEKPGLGGGVNGYPSPPPDMAVDWNS